MQLFLSTVTDEFRSYRDHLRHALDRPDVTVKAQEDFIVSGTPTLELLDDYIRQCDGVIHLVGDMTGSPARPQSLAAIRERYPDLAEKLKPIAECLQPEGTSLSYTQWEAWLALLHGKKLFIATPDAEAPRDGKYAREPAQIQAQQDHLARLRAKESYPGITFKGVDHLAWNLLRSFILDGLVEARLDLLRPPPTTSDWTWPGAWPFSGYLREKRKGFIGRRWLFDAVRAWYSDPAASQALRIEADFGVGKSAFMAELAATGTSEQGLPVAAYHFCERNTAATLDAATFVRSVAVQLAGFLPAYQAAVEDDPDARRWLDKAQEDPISAFTNAVSSKLDGIAVPATPLLLLIDGLDETLGGSSSHASGNGCSIVDLLAKTTKELPIWLKVLATSRRHQEVRQPLEGVYACDVLNAEQARNLSDIRDYVLARCAVEPLASQLAQAGRSPEDLAAQLASPEQKRSGGKFLYAVRVLTALANNRLTADQIDALPPGMDGFYRDAFRHRFPQGDDFEPMRQLLGVLCVQREPLTRQALGAILGVRENELRRQLSRIEDFLRIGKASSGPATAPGKAELTYSFDHLSLAQWLTEENESGFPHATEDYAVDQEAARERIRAWARDEVAAGRAHQWPYLIRHLGQHLEAAERKLAYSRLLLDPNWLRARLEATSVNSLLSEFSEAPANGVFRALELALRQSSHVIGRDKGHWRGSDQLFSQLLARLQQKNEPELAGLCCNAERLIRAGDGAVPLTPSLQTSTVRELRFQSGLGRVMQLQVLTDGRLASFSVEGEEWKTRIQLWNANDPTSGHQDEACLTIHGRSVNPVKELPQGKLACFDGWGQSNWVVLWDVNNAECTQREHAKISAIEVLSDGTLATASRDGWIKLWDKTSQDCLSSRRAHVGWVLDLVSLPEGRLASIADEREEWKRTHIGRELDYSTLKVWDIANSMLVVRHIFKFHQCYISFPLLLPDGSVAFLLTDENKRMPPKIGIMDPVTGHHRFFFVGTSYEDRIEKLLMLPGGYILSAARDGVVKTWNPVTGTCIGTCQLQQSEIGLRCMIAFGSRFVAAVNGNKDYTTTPIMIWDLTYGNCASTLGEAHSRTEALAQLPDGRIASGHNNIIDIWNLEYSEDLIADVRTAHAGLIRNLAILSDGRVASAATDGAVKLWDLSTFTCHIVIEHDVDELIELRDGSLAGISSDGTINLWDPSTGASLGCHKPHFIDYIYEGIHGLFEDGTFVTKDMGSCISLRNITSRQLLSQYESMLDPCPPFVKLPDGRISFFSIFIDSALLIAWDPARGKICFGEAAAGAFAYAHQIGVLDLVVLQDGRLASGGISRGIEIWDPLSLICTDTLDFSIGVTSLLALPGGGLVSGSESGEITLWYSDSQAKWKGKLIFHADYGISDLKYVAKKGILAAGDAAGGMHFIDLVTGKLSG